MKQNLLNKELELDNVSFNRSKNHLKLRVIPKAKTAIEAYNKLGALPKFTPTVWNEIAASNGESVKLAYSKLAEKEASKFLLPAMKSLAFDEAKKEVGHFIKAWKDFLESLNANSLITDPVNYTPEYLIIDDNNEPQPNEPLLREIFTLKIETEAQAAIYEAALKCQDALGHLQVLFEGEGIDFRNTLWTTEAGKDALFDVAIDGRLSFNPWSLKWI